MPPTPKWQIWTIFGLLILLLGLGGYYLYQRKISNPPPAPPEKPAKLINAIEIPIELSNESDLIQELNIASSKNALSEGEFQVFLFFQDEEGINNYLSPGEFFNSANLNPHQDLFSQTSAVNLGRFRKLGKINSFLIIKINSAEDAVKGAEKWEKLMPEELGAIFPELKNFQNTAPILFQNRIIKNLEAKIFESADGKEIVWALFNNNLLIITTSPKALEEIISRYSIFPPN